MKKKAIKIAASTAVAASAFVAAAPVQQADAATNVNQLATNAQNAGTVLKWAISVEGSADYKTLPTAQYNAAKAAVKAAEDAAAKLSATEKLSIQAKLVEPKTQVKRAMAYIDAINSSTKIVGLTDTLNSAIKSGDLAQVEKAYHSASFEFKTKQAKLLDRVYGQSTRDGIRNAVKPAMEAALESVKYDVTVKMHLDKADTLIKENKLEEAAKELGKARYNLDLKDAKFTFKTQLEKSYSDVAAALPLQALQAVGDGKNTVTVKFSKEYLSTEKITSLEAGQFKISGLTVQSAKLSDDKRSVVLTTSNQKADTEYTVVWQGKSVTFKTPAVADTSGIAINQTDVAYLETTDTRTFTSKLTNSDGTPYVGGVSITLPSTGARLTTVNGTLVSNVTTWTGVTDSNGNLVFTVGVPTGSASVVDVEATIKKTDSLVSATTEKKTAKTHFFKLAADGNVPSLAVKKFYISAENDYVYANSLKYKWDANDQFFIRGQVVSQAAFETALSNGDTLAVDYKAKVENSSTWNITNDVTLAADVEFTNPAKEKVTFDGYNYDLSGTAQAGYTVKVYRGTTLMGTTVADSSGNWTLRGVNLTQNVGNEFKAYQYAPGKDGANGVGSEGTDTVLINEGEFASQTLSLTDIGDAGLSIGDTVNFTFERSAYGHEFKKDLKGTLTVADGLGQTVVVNVEYVNVNTLKVTGFATSNDKFKNNSNSLTVIDATGVVNQDQLAYNVAESTDVTLDATGNGGTGLTSGTVEIMTVGAAGVNGTIVVNGVAYTISSSSVLKNEVGVTEQAGTTINVPVGTKVFGISSTNGVINSISYEATAADKAAAKTVIDAINALDSTKATYAADVAAARNLISTATTTAKQRNLITNLDKLVAAEKSVQANIVANAKSALTLGDTSAVTANLTLPATGTGTTITWATSDATVVTAGGVVARPTFTAGDKTVTLTATIKSTVDPSVTDTKTFTVKVIKLAQSDVEKAQVAADALAVTYAAGDSATSVTEDLTLPTTGSNGSTVSWSSSDTRFITDLGAVTQPAGADVPVQLTATVTVGSSSVTKVFSVIVKGN